MIIIKLYKKSSPVAKPNRWNGKGFDDSRNGMNAIVNIKVDTNHSRYIYTYVYMTIIMIQINT
jgi:hypothetical protein